MASGTDLQFYRRADLRKVAQAKFEDAVLLLENGRYGNAYYLAGYAVEIAFKVCAARLFMKDVIPDRRFVNDIYQHNLQSLLSVAGLLGEWKIRKSKDSLFAENWALVAKWDSETRYVSTDRLLAQVMIQAVGDTNSGVYPWIKQHW